MTPAELRRTWARLYGLDDSETEQTIRDQPPVDEAWERDQLDAVRQIKGQNE